MRRVDPQQLLKDAKAGVARDVERKQSGRTDPPAMSEPDQHSGQRQIPDQLVEEGRLEGGELLVAGRAVGAIDLKPPRQRGRTAEQLLVEVVADPADRLGHQQPGSGGVHESEEVRPRQAAAKHPQTGQRACGDSTPDSEAALPDGERSPPVRGNLIPAGDEEVDAPADQPGWETPEGDLTDQVRITARAPPAPAREQNRRGYGEDVGQAVGMHEQRTNPQAMGGRAGDERRADHAGPGDSSTGSTRSATVRSTALRVNGSRRT